MNFENKLARLMRNSGPARFLVPFGLILILAAVMMLGFNSESFEETSGRITSVMESINAENQQEYEVSFSYTVNGKDYEGFFQNLSGTYSEGSDIQVYYDPENPERIASAKTSAMVPPVMFAAGLAAIACGIWLSMRAFRKSKELDQTTPGRGTVPAVDFEAFKQAPGVTEYYFRYDGNTLKPGYVLEDADRKVLFEGKMLKNALVGARVFSFTDSAAGVTQEHEVGHTVTQSVNNETFSARSSFKFDGQNIWNVLHDRGLRLSTNLRSQFPKMVYEVSRDGAAFARIETSSIYVHEEDEAQHKLAVPSGNMYYRCWTDSRDFEMLFLTVFAISETEQMMVE